MRSQEHPRVAEWKAAIQYMVDELLADGERQRTCPAASAVAATLIGKLRNHAGDQAVPLDLLVTPSSRPYWRSLFGDDVVSRAALVERLRLYEILYPEAVKQPDDTIGVPMGWKHPDNPGVNVIRGPRAMHARWVFLRLVENPDDWRVERIG